MKLKIFYLIVLVIWSLHLLCNAFAATTSANCLPIPQKLFEYIFLLVVTAILIALFYVTISYFVRNWNCRKNSVKEFLPSPEEMDKIAENRNCLKSQVLDPICCEYHEY
jgi:hypothetical protein